MNVFLAGQQIRVAGFKPLHDFLPRPRLWTLGQSAGAQQEKQRGIVPNRFTHAELPRLTPPLKTEQRKSGLCAKSGRLSQSRRRRKCKNRIAKRKVARGPN